MLAATDTLLHAAAPRAAAREASRGLLLLAVTMACLAIIGAAAALLLQRTAPGADPYREVGVATLALAVAGLLAAAGIWRRWQRAASAHRVMATRLSDFHAVMSQTNRLILRRPDPRELFDGVCAICVEAGGLDRVVVDIATAGEGHCTAQASIDTLSTASPQVLLDGARLQALVSALALAAGRLVVVDEASADARLAEMRPWFLATGLRSLAAVPLRRGGRPVGILLLCSRSTTFFGGEVSSLLSELGADLSFALDNSDRERERHSALLADHARAAAEDANRAKTEFLAQMSHELRTPLNAMLGFAQLLATDPDDALSAAQAEQLRRITHAGWHLLGLVNDVMDISRIESGRFEVVNIGTDVSAVVDEAVALSQPLALANEVRLTGRAPSRSGIGVVVDARRLAQVLLNLLSNACKYNRPGGHARLDVTRAGAEVFFDVVDDGVGMTREQLSHLFEPFNRLGNEGHAIEGSGIGLTLTRQIVEMMNGRLEIESDPASGTRARLVLPSYALPLEAPAGETSRSRTARPAQDGGLVLCIEDNEVNQILVEQMLLRCDGVRLLQAFNGEDGIALARSRRPDLILLDMGLPDMTGFDVLDALRDDPLTRSLRVVVLSANAMPADVARARKLGILDYWIKPVTLEAFVTGISAVLATRVATDAADAWPVAASIAG